MKLLLLLYPVVCLLVGTVSGEASWAREAGMHAVILTVLAAALVAGWRRARWLLVGGLFEPALVLLFLVLIAGALGAPCPERSWPMVVLAAAVVAVFYLALGLSPKSQVPSPKSERQIGNGTPAAQLIIAATGVAAAAIGLAAYFARWTPRVAAPLGHHNYMAGFLVLHLPITLAAARQESRWRILWLAGAALEVLAILLTGSLAGIVALVVYAVALAGTGPRSKVQGPRSHGGDLGPSGRRYAVAATIVIALVGGALWFRSSHSPVIDALRQRLASIAGAGYDPSLSLDNRLRYLRTGLAMTLARPLAGFGAGSVPFVAALYRPQAPGIMPPGELIPQLHNLPVNLLAETGIVGCAAALLLVLLAIAGRSGPAATAVWLYLLFSLSDYQLDLPAILFPLAAIAGLAAGPNAVQAEPGGAPRWLALGGLLAAIAAGAALCSSASVAHYYYHQGDVPRAAGLEPRGGFYDFQAGARAEAAGRSGPALLSYLAAARRMPNVIPAAEQAGSLLEAIGEHRQAMPWLERAAALDYYFTLAHFHLGRARLATGDRAGAIEEFAASMLVQPATVLAEEWRNRPQRDVYEPSLERALDKLYALAATYPRSGPWRRWNELGAFLSGRRNLLPDGSQRVLCFEVTDSDLAMSRSLIVFRRPALPARIAPVVLRSPTPNLLAPAGLGLIENLPPVRAIDLLKRPET